MPTQDEIDILMRIHDQAIQACKSLQQHMERLQASTRSSDAGPPLDQRDEGDERAGRDGEEKP